MRLKKDQKRPDGCEWQKSKNKSVVGHRGIITGKINNSIVLDVDDKDDGVEEFNKYVSKFGEPNTFKVKTQGGGYHYYFKYFSSNSDTNFLIDNYITNSSKYRGKGIDIRTNGGQVVAPGCKIGNKEYKIMNYVPMNELPNSLCNWLLESYTRKEAKEQKQAKEIPERRDYHYFVDDETLRDILSKLDKHWCDNYIEWVS